MTVVFVDHIDHIHFRRNHISFFNCHISDKAHMSASIRRPNDKTCNRLGRKAVKQCSRISAFLFPFSAYEYLHAHFQILANLRRGVV